MNALEQRFMERMPSILIDLTKAVEELSKEVAELKGQIKTANELSAVGGE